MSLADRIHRQFPSHQPADDLRRHDLLAGLLRTFEQGGGEAVTAELSHRLDELQKEFDRRLERLHGKLF
jgi:hypothetical protein